MKANKISFLHFRPYCILLITITLLTTNSAKAQDYLTLDNLFTLSTNDYANVYDIKDAINAKGYYSDDLDGPYKDSYGNELEFYKFEDVVYMDYKIKATANAIRIFQDEIKDVAFFTFTSDDRKRQFYQSLGGGFSFTLEKTPGFWEFSVNQNKKGDPSPANAYAPNKIQINSFTTYTKIHIKKGDKIWLKASGSITLGPWAGDGSPDGIGGYTSYSVNPSFPHGALLGRVGNGPWFFVGSYKTFTAEESGSLSLIVNDDDPSNNRGFFDVEYGINRVIPPPPAQPLTEQKKEEPLTVSPVPEQKQEEPTIVAPVQTVPGSYDKMKAVFSSPRKFTGMLVNTTAGRTSACTVELSLNKDTTFRMKGSVDNINLFGTWDTKGKMQKDGNDMVLFEGTVNLSYPGSPFPPGTVVPISFLVTISENGIKGTSELAPFTGSYAPQYGTLDVHR